MLLLLQEVVVGYVSMFFFNVCYRLLCVTLILHLRLSIFTHAGKVYRFKRKHNSLKIIFFNALFICLYL